jgi:hypothetical protein
MGPLTALLFATPLFGLSLNIDPSVGQPPAVIIDAGAVLAVQVSMMTVTVAAGFIQFYNKYGWWDSQANNPCVRGDAIFGQGQCSGQPTLHLTLGVLTSALYFTTFGLSFAMPDPLKVSEGNSDFARKLRTHKILRWVTFAGMLAQIGLGVAIANSNAFGLDRANNYKTLRALATTHLALGLVTWGAMTWTGSIMLF